LTPTGRIFSFYFEQVGNPLTENDPIMRLNDGEFKAYYDAKIIEPLDELEGVGYWFIEIDFIVQ